MRAFTSLHLAVLDNKSELRVLQGRLDDADELLRAATDLAAGSPGLRNSWQHLAATESRVRLLHLRGCSQQATELARAAEQDAERRSDGLLRLSYRLLRASILLDTGSRAEATPVLRELILQRDELSRAQDLELDRMLGEYFALQGSTALAHDHVLRAARLQDCFSSAITRVHLQRTARSVGLPDIGVQGQPNGQPATAFPRDTQEPPLDSVSLKSVEQLFQLASVPELLGREVLSLLLRARCVTDAAIHSEPVDGRRGPDGEPSRLVIPLGSFLGRAYRIDATPRDSIEPLEAFMTIRRLCAAAVHANELRTKEAVRTSLWRFDAIAPEGAPLVVAGIMQQVLATVHQLASSNAPVLFTGETGTGKEVFARELHRASRARGPFVPFNCAAVASDMLDAQLFGHRRGAFTGATENFQGIVRSAADGTLFLDEIGELNVELQPKLLRLLDRSEVHPLGEPQPLPVRVRLAAATNANLDAAIASGRFRDDLFYRLSVGRIHIPPLRERREEIPPLADHYLERYARDAARPRLTLSDDALEALLLYRWPGNVRQLASEMRRLVAFCKGGSVVDADQLSPDIRPPRAARSDAPDPQDEDGVRIALDQPLDAAIEQLERAMLQFAFAAEGGHVERAAERLGLSRKGLFLKRRRLRLDP